MKKWLLACIGLAVFISVLFAFWKNGPTNEVKLGEDITLLASGKSVPSNFEESAFQEENHPGNKYLVKKADNQISYQKMWSYFRLDSASIPAVDFSKKAVVFIGLYESGSCPYKIEEAEIRTDEKELAIRIAAPARICTTDASPKTFVIGIEKDAPEKMKNIVVVQGRKEISVPMLEE